jgi:hypothetical protein
MGFEISIAEVITHYIAQGKKLGFQVLVLAD